MATKNVTVNFQPVLGLSLPVQVRVEFVKNIDGSTLANKYFNCNSPVATDYEFPSVDGLEAVDADMSISCYIQDAQGQWQMTVPTPGIPPADASVVFFNGYQIGVI